MTGEELNKHRRERYRKDSAYRTRVILSKRLRYKAHAVQAGRKLRNCLIKLPKLKVFGRTRPVTQADGTVSRMLCFSVRELASVLGYHPVIVRQWIQREKFPLGPLKTSVFPYHRVYTFEQAHRIVEIIGAVQQSTQYFYDTDTDIIKALHDAVPDSKNKTTHEHARKKVRNKK